MCGANTAPQLHTSDTGVTAAPLLARMRRESGDILGRVNKAIENYFILLIVTRSRGGRNVSIFVARARSKKEITSLIYIRVFCKNLIPQVSRNVLTLGHLYVFILSKFFWANVQNVLLSCNYIAPLFASSDLAHLIISTLREKHLIYKIW